MRVRRVGVPTDIWSRLVGDLGGRASATVLGSAAVSAVGVSVRTGRRVGPARAAALGVVAADLVGGLVTFQLRPTREKYAASSIRSRLVFAAVHVQPFLLPALGEGSWRRASVRYATAVIATVALESLAAGSGSRRAVANGVAAAISAVDLASDRSTQRWFGPVYLMKVIGGHAGIRRA